MLWLWVALAVGALALLGAGFRTARRPELVLERTEAKARWSELHGGYDQDTGSVFLRGWLTGIDVLARPLARRGVQPDVLTWTSLWLGLLVLALAEPVPALAAVVVVASGGFDSLDGAVAVLTERTSRWGAVLDSAVDRGTDALYLVVLAVLGAPVLLVAATGFVILELEYVRARSAGVGGSEVGVVTAAERPTRVIVLTFVLLTAQILPSRADLSAVTGAVVLLVLTSLGLLQVSLAVRRTLR